MQAAFFDKMPLQPLLLTPLDGVSEEKEGITYKTKKKWENRKRYHPCCDRERDRFTRKELQSFFPKTA